MVPAPKIPENLAPEQLEALRAQLSADLWAAGQLRYKLHGNQTALYDRIRQRKPRQYFALWTRRGGKSMFGITLAVETALRIPGARILYLAPHAKNAKEIVTDQLPEFLEDCPAALRPQFNGQSNELIFKHKSGPDSIIRFKGVNSEKADDLRGSFAHLVVLDEAGSMDNLDYVVSSVARPMTSTTKGLILLLTTPPNSPSHESAAIYDRLKAIDCTFEVTLVEAENPKLDYEEKSIMLRDAGETEEDIPEILAGLIPPKTTTARREYFCFWESDAGLSVIPDYIDARKDIYVDPGEAPPHRDCYVGADWGYSDATGVVFGYYDVRRGKLVIEDEWFEHHAGTPRLAEAVHNREREHFGERGDHNVYRVCDVDPRLRADLAELHGLLFANADKKDKNANIELLRQWVRRRQIIVHPRCVKLDRQLRNAIFDKRGKDFQRMDPGDDMSKNDFHFDLLAALVYLVRYVHTRRKADPTPPWSPPEPGQRATLRHLSRQPLRNSLLDETPLTRRLYGRRR